MIATQVASPFLAPFKLALYLSVYCGAPMILYQLWGFIAPGLYDNEKKIAGPLLISASSSSTQGWHLRTLLSSPWYLASSQP